MAVPALNNQSVTNQAFSESLTVVFSRAKPAFSMQTFGNSIYYQLGFLPIGLRDVSWEFGEHFLGPSSSTFTDVLAENGPPNSLFAGIRVRAGGVTQTPTPSVTVN